MITEKELNSINLSATKRDFYQIWNELLETADKLSERWSPVSTNESDPGIVLLKVLTAIADKLNYTIDKNTLECFMPSAAQEESMRKLCDMLGYYNMKYYRSATVDVKIAYTGDTALTDTDSIKIPAFTPLQNSDEDVNYFTLETITLDKINSSGTVSCMEGILQYCSEDTDNIITMAQIDDNYRYYLPENQIAENGIFITNIDDSTESDLWEKVDNLNVQEVGKLCFKFGYDSNLQRPYIQFPEDISTIIEDGLIIRYTRTNGINGNISYNTLSKIIFTESDTTSTEGTNSLKVSENFAVKNLSASINGADRETITDAYNAYKKTIGTFDTLVTCRDYMNKIYQMTISDTDTTPLVSNIIVSDIRDDINRAITLCTFEDQGIAYKDQPLLNGTESKISNFDLVLYPFTNISGTPSETSYKKSFIYSLVNSNEIESDLTKNKTISHNIIYPDESDIVCIVNYLRLKAKITTTTKVNSIEEALILDNIYKTLYKNFNLRKLDFGEEIPFDSILEVIQNADTRIKNVALEDPYIITKFRLAGATSEGDDIEFLAKSSDLDKAKSGWEYYNKLALRNILAGRVALFDYNEEFKPLYSETEAGGNIKPIYKRDSNGYIGKITTSFKIERLSDTGLILDENEVVQFRAPNFKTKTTWPAYVNYYLHLEKGSEDDNDAIPATFGTLFDYMNGSSIFSDQQSGEKWTNFLCKNSGVTLVKKILEEDTFKEAQTKYGAIVYFDGDNRKIANNYSSTIEEYYVFEPTETTYGELYNFIKKQYANYREGPSYATLKGIFRSLGSDQSREIGEMIDVNKIKYTYAYKYNSSQSFLTTHYIQITHAGETSDYTKDGLGKNAVYSGILANSDYQLGTNEWLVINYTPSTTADDGTVSTGTPVSEVYEENTIIRPSFNLIDSRNYKKQQHSPTKTSGYNIESLTSHPTKLSEIQNNGGMFTLGTNEQIELRDIAQVYLDGSSLNLYWIRQEDATVKEGGTAYFYFDNDIPGNTTGTYHTLLEGEYIYYTDGSKLDYGWYGKGTRIKKGDYTPILSKIKQNEADLQKQILSEGLLVALPWIQYNWSREDEAKPSSKGLTATEYQYISLVKDDTLNALSLKNGKELANLADNWYAVDSATYTLSGSQTHTTLKQISLSENNKAWEAHTILNLNSAPTVVQTLHAKNNNNKVSDTITLHYYKWDSSTGKEEENSSATKKLTPTLTGDEADLSFETNYLCQSSAGVIDTHIYDSSSSATTNQDKAPNDFSVKVFKNSPVSSEISINNYGTGHWTKIIFKNLTDGEANLHINLLENTNGLIMLYYAPTKASEPDKMAKLTYTGSDGKELEIYLCNKKNWWDDTMDQRNYYLRSGLNIIQLKNSGTLTISEKAQAGNLIFSDLDLINTDSNGKLKINPYLDYKALVKDKTALEQAFEDILKIDPEYTFYYNAIIDASTAIDLNTNIDSTSENAELLSSSATWYDYNNINNKFVISEIDADYLKTGITLTNSSRR